MKEPDWEEIAAGIREQAEGGRTRGSLWSMIANELWNAYRKPAEEQPRCDGSPGKPGYLDRNPRTTEHPCPGCPSCRRREG